MADQSRDHVRDKAGHGRASRAAVSHADGGAGAGRGGVRAGGRHPLYAAAAVGELLQHPANALRYVPIPFTSTRGVTGDQAPYKLMMEARCRGRQGAGEDQAPQIGQGAAVHLQVRRHLHPRRRGPPQRQETPRRLQGAVPQPPLLVINQQRHLA